MARTREPGRAQREKLVELLSNGPRHSSDLGFKAWVKAFGRTINEFIEDDLPDKAAALTYYGVLSIFPGLLVFVALIGLLDDKAADKVIDNILGLTSGATQQIVVDGVTKIQENEQSASAIVFAGLVIAFWSASGYIGAFMRAANTIYDVPEGRPLWKMIPIRLFVTLVTVVFLVLSAVAIVFTGGLAETTGAAMGLESQTVTLFNILKWPGLVLGFGLMIALLYWAAPNARQRFRLITPGSTLAVLTWVAVSAGFAYYVARFDSYNKTYGAIGGIIIFLVWMWLTNVAVLLGAEFDAELARAKAIAAGLPKHEEPYLPLRDVPKQEPVADNPLHRDTVVDDPVVPPVPDAAETAKPSGRRRLSKNWKDDKGPGDDPEPPTKPTIDTNWV
ncbi:membrane protein [Allocatelliglobosispora scoriae]|uniref:Membrane protein n=1 Tax=Allocatelliglobosispora scoriae TaxID=643052 RepID=A0A841BW26_9ACTN|nr:YihY/virulence factor BrkB family protein [Allocatelliglobosispora scoriae]MBB5873307.1 membrane protein [Allocatelliglobosispora scoriae]